MIKKLDITAYQTATEVLSVQIASYMVEAEIISYNKLPPLQDTVESLQQCKEIFYGCFINGNLCGAISFKIEDQVLDIHRLMVHPSSFNKGIAQQLLDSVTENNQIHKYTVSTGKGNLPATRFYEKNGFSITHERKMNDQLQLVFFEKIRNELHDGI
ncbi:GNAT family N-acetyltransferase [Gracilibacillus xinjiangensis]|uniref:GNAT family N-acetyltransferase n=1 Tax=Gracilibacillus xinjiangensis TaxID=1193282 RepID=A0ABV8WY26_9BACI